MDGFLVPATAVGRKAGGIGGAEPLPFLAGVQTDHRITPLQFMTRERMLHAQRLIRETTRSLIEIALEVGYASPSHFAQVFRRTAGMAPMEFRNAL
jgi:AraC family transcriptional regulator